MLSPRQRRCRPKRAVERERAVIGGWKRLNLAQARGWHSGTPVPSLGPYAHHSAQTPCIPRPYASASAARWRARSRNAATHGSAQLRNISSPRQPGLPRRVRVESAAWIIYAKTSPLSSLTSPAPLLPPPSASRAGAETSAYISPGHATTARVHHAKSSSHHHHLPRLPSPSYQRPATAACMTIDCTVRILQDDSVS